MVRFVAMSLVERLARGCPGTAGVPDLAAMADSEYTFLKTFDQELYGYQLSRLVQLDADQGTPDASKIGRASCRERV